MKCRWLVCGLAAVCLLVAGALTGEEAAKPAQQGPFSLDSDGFILNWLMLGPFPNPGDRPDNKGYFIDYLKDFGGEVEHTPSLKMEIPGGATNLEQKVKWQAYTSQAPNINFFDVPHLKLTDQQDDVLVYAACWVEAEKDVDVEVRVGSDDAYKLWIDHKKIAEVHEYRAAEQDQEKYPMKLTAGKHLILIKVDQDYGGFEFLLRIVTSEGKKAAGIKVWN
jgi:hypothetical protein